MRDEQYDPSKKRPYLCAGITCEYCKKIISDRSWRKNYFADSTMICEVCDEKRPLYRAFKRWNEMIDEEERKAINKLHYEIYALGDVLRDMSRSRTFMNCKDYKEAGEKIMDLIALIPWFYGQNEGEK